MAEESAKTQKIEKNHDAIPPKPEVEIPLPPEKKEEEFRVPEKEKPPVEIEALPAEEVAPPPPEKAEKPPAAPLPPPPAKSPTLKEIENILEEDIADIYFKMPPEKREEFKKKGEEAASKIEQLIETGKAIAKKILKLIKDWLKIIPGIDKYFLEQEAKIKTDKIMKIGKGDEH